MDPKIETGWKEVLLKEFNAPYFHLLRNFLQSERSDATIYPPGNKIFSAFNHTPFHTVKVIILGQDPYHGQGQAHGLCFSVPSGVKKPPSLINIFKELHRDTGSKIPENGNLESWAKQGVLLLNATLTVRAHQPGSHQKKGWEIFTNAIIKLLSDQKSGLVFMLWGKYAQAKEELINTNKHHVLKAPHPSPLSASKGFFGCGHFSKTNDLLRKSGKIPIDWNLI
ncbi:MAG: uracil-DNA glycosylase [Bacteroidales bacterium]|nr:uracil-DNA glycosylase [Bacteroidales bacterium]